MKTKMVRYTQKTLPRLTKADRAKLKTPAARPESEIDTRDIPEMTDKQVEGSKTGTLLPPASHVR